MKKRILTVICLIFFASIMAHSQIRLGIQGGFDVIDHNIDVDVLKASNRLGFRVGPTLEALIPATGWGADISVLYGHKEYSIKQKEDAVDITDYNYITIPLNIKKRISIIGIAGVFISAGPYASVKLSGGDLKLANEEFKAKNFEAGINAGAGVSLLDKLDLGMYYKCKLTDNYKNESTKLDHIGKERYQTWSMALTYYF